jgi:beta-glucosidase
VTLFHWDYPNELEMQGGWLNPSSPDWFAEYTAVVAKAFGDRVKNFITFNEPQIFTWLGYDRCTHAPGIKYPVGRILAVCRNIALAHGKSVQKLRELVPDCRVGYAPTCGNAYWPVKETDLLAAKAKELQDSIGEEDWIHSSAFWNELFIKGRFHRQCPQLFGEDLPELSEGDRLLISQPLDFCGMNLYQGTSVNLSDTGELILGKLPAGHGKTGMGWPITPKAMYWAVKNFYDTYRLPLFITENGMSALDVVSLDGGVHDPCRIDYLERHLSELKRAVSDGAKVEGYFLWSFLDNFEWEKGYDDRFGIVYVDYETQRRIPKDSFYWYQNIIKS